EMQQRRFTGARFAHQRQHFALVHIERDIAEDRQVGSSGTVDLREVARANVAFSQSATITQVTRARRCAARVLVCDYTCMRRLAICLLGAAGLAAQEAPVPKAAISGGVVTP